jgi:hypothetical protein
VQAPPFDGTPPSPNASSCECFSPPASTSPAGQTCLYRDLYYKDGRYLFVTEGLGAPPRCRGPVSLGAVQGGGNGTGFAPEWVEGWAGWTRVAYQRAVLEAPLKAVVLLERYQPNSHGHMLHDAAVALFAAMAAHAEPARWLHAR